MGLPGRPGRASVDRAADNSYSGSLSRRQSERRPIDDDFGGRRSVDTYGGTDTSPSSRRKPSQDIYRQDDRRRPSQDIPTRRSEDRELGGNVMRRPSASASTTSESTSASNAQSATAGMGMIIPNKSTIAEEEIEVPYGREARDSSSTAIDDRERDRQGERSKESDIDGEGDLGRPRSPPSSSALGDLSGLTARLQAVDVDDDDGAARSGEDYFDKMSFGRASVASDRSTGAAGIGSRMLSGGRVSLGDENEKLRRDYEFKIATMQNRIATLERDVGDANLNEQRWQESEERLRSVEGELEEFRRVRALDIDSIIMANSYGHSYWNRRLHRLCHCNRSSTLRRRISLGRRIWLRDVRAKTKKSYKFCEIAVSNSNRNEEEAEM